MNNLAKFFGYATAGLGFLALVTLIYLYGAWAGAFVGVHLWTWFIVPTFGLPTLTMTQAFGVSLLIGFWTFHYHSGHKDERPISTQIAELIGVFASPWITLLIGYICHHFFM